MPGGETPLAIDLSTDNVLLGQLLNGQQNNISVFLEIGEMLIPGFLELNELDIKLVTLLKKEQL